MKLIDNSTTYEVTIFHEQTDVDRFAYKSFHLQVEIAYTEVDSPTRYKLFRLH